MKPFCTEKFFVMIGSIRFFKGGMALMRYLT